MEQPLDPQVLAWVGRWSTGGLQTLMLVVYLLTGKGVMPVLVALCLLLLARRRLWHEVMLVGSASAGIFVLVDLLLKPLLARARPAGALLLVDGHSFPSGHTAGAVVFSLSLAAVVAKHRPQWRGTALLVSVAWIVVVGLSTLVVRAHWPSDVLAGGALGLAWLNLCLTLWRQGTTSASRSLPR